MNAGSVSRDERLVPEAISRWSSIDDTGGGTTVIGTVGEPEVCQRFLGAVAGAMIGEALGHQVSSMTVPEIQARFDDPDTLPLQPVEGDESSPNCMAMLAVALDARTRLDRALVNGQDTFGELRAAYDLWASGGSTASERAGWWSEHLPQLLAKTTVPALLASGLAGTSTAQPEVLLAAVPASLWSRHNDEIIKHARETPNPVRRNGVDTFEVSSDDRPGKCAGDHSVSRVADRDSQRLVETPFRGLQSAGGDRECRSRCLTVAETRHRLRGDVVSGQSACGPHRAQDLFVPELGVLRSDLTEAAAVLPGHDGVREDQRQSLCRLDRRFTFTESRDSSRRSPTTPWRSSVPARPPTSPGPSAIPPGDVDVRRLQQRGGYGICLGISGAVSL